MVSLISISLAVLSSLQKRYGSTQQVLPVILTTYLPVYRSNNIAMNQHRVEFTKKIVKIMSTLYFETCVTAKS